LGAQWPPDSPSSATDATIGVVDEAVRGKRSKMLVAAGVALALGAGGTLWAATRSDESFSLKAAAQAASESKNIELVMSMKLDVGERELPESLSEVNFEIVLDGANDRSSIVMDVAIFGGDGDTEMIIDAASETAYMSTTSFGDVLSTDAKWIDMGAESAGSDTAFDQISANNPLDVAPLLKTADEVDVIGFDELDGVKVKHYKVTLSVDDLRELNPDFDQQWSGFDYPGVDVVPPDEVAYNVYVDEGNTMRRVIATLDLGEIEAEIDMVVKRIGDDVPGVELPDPDDVESLDDLD
jgi:hypothetical protein